jgi:hypothetical protein
MSRLLAFIFMPATFTITITCNNPGINDKYRGTGAFMECI